MDKTIIDIIEQERDQINELMELNRRTAAAEAKLDRLFMLFEEGHNDILPFIERTKEELAGMKEMQTEYQQELKELHYKLTKYVENLTSQKEINYIKPIRRKDITLEQAKEILIKANEKRKNRRRSRRVAVLREGRVKYVKINKVQD